MKMTITFLCLLLAFISTAQKTPYFLTTFYFEDAIGNIDSIEVGYDLTANHGNNPDFGEVTDLSPFDSVFDVRAVNYFEYYNTTPPINPLNLIVNRIVGGASKAVNAPCIGGDDLLFFIHAIHQPVTISVKDLEEFKKIDCPGKNNTWSFFSPDRMYHFIEPWGWTSLPRVRYGCIYKGPYTVYLGGKYIPVEVGERPYTLQYEITGRGVDTIYGVCFSIDHTFYQCDSTYVMDTQEEEGLINGVVIYPNPNSGIMNVELKGTEYVNSFEIYDHSGNVQKRIPVNEGKDIRIEVPHLVPGIYFLRVNTKYGPRVSKFIKI
jgi:hypothetical protein